MMHAIPPRQEYPETIGPTSQSPEDYYSALVNVVAEAANDPARVRKLVYAVVRSNLNPEMVFSPSLTDATWQAKTLFELDQAFQIERAIRRLEERTAPLPVAPQPDAVSYAEPESFAAPTMSSPPASYLNAPEAAQPPAPEPPVSRAALLAALEAVARELPKKISPVAPEPPRPSWLVPAAEIVSAAAGIRPGQRLWTAWVTLPTHVHVVVAALVAAAFITGISGLTQRGRGAAAGGTIEAKAPAPAVSVALKGAKMMETVGHAPAQTTGSETAAPFPAPRSFGVYAANNGLLTQLDSLPVTISIAHMRASAEVTEPSRVTLAGDKLSFVVFDRDFANGAPQTVSAHVVGRVSRLVKYVDGRVRVTPFAGSWRVRDRAYEFRVSPLEGRDILVIRPDPGIVLPAGRYALVLNGRGYDFTVAGKITANEQCLEQTEVVNGVVVGDCTNL
jgi:hypothetical protein